MIAAETFGRPGDPAILLIHGAGNCMLWWDEELCERLAAGGRFVIRYDVRGGDGSIRDLVADALRLLDALEVGRAHIVGMSLGGAVAQLLALDHPDRVASLVLASATPGGPGHPQPDLPGMSEELAASFADEPPAPDWSDRDAVVDYLVEAERPFSPRFDEQWVRAIAERMYDSDADLEAHLSGAFSLAVGEPWRERLGEITAPALVIHGTADPLFPYGHAVALADEIAGAELLPLEHTGHEYFPRASWDVVVPAILRHTAGERVQP